MLFIYSLLLYIIAPFIPLYLHKRAKKNHKYSLLWHERFGFRLKNKSTKPIIWLHAVSVGETRAMYKLVYLLYDKYPQYQILITSMTPTGRDTASELYPFANLQYLPYDLPHAVNSFYKTFKPVIGVIMETEIWPNLLHGAKKRNIPLYIINARLSDKSLRGYLKAKWLICPALNSVTSILCQDKISESNFIKLTSVANIQTVGNTKFDLVLEDKIIDIINEFKKIIGARKVIAFASTRDGEEQLILNHLDKLSDYLVLIIPRHPERFSVLERMLNHQKIKYQKRSEALSIHNDTPVIIGDSLGEMLAYYAIADLAIIGGSFGDFGGQNPIEAIFMHKPVIFGQSMYNFTTVANDALLHKCAIQVLNMDECVDKVTYILNNGMEYDSLKNNCQSFIDSYQGASDRVLKIIQNHL